MPRFSTKATQRWHTALITNVTKATQKIDKRNVITKRFSVDVPANQRAIASKTVLAFGNHVAKEPGNGELDVRAVHRSHLRQKS